MTDGEEIEVSVWEHLGAGDWAMVGSVGEYERLETESRHQDVGPWAMTLGQGHQARAVMPRRLVTTELRGNLETWRLAPRTMNRAADGQLTVTLGGFDALSILGWPLAFPSPLKPLTEQGREGNYAGPAETVIRDLVTQNLGTRYGMAFDAPASLGRGAVVRSRPRFVNLLEEVLRVAKLGGIGVRFGLRRTDGSTRARLTLDFYEPRDRTVRVHLSAADGSVTEWESVENEPTLTAAIVGGIGEGAGQKLLRVTTPESEAQAEEWGGHREGYVDGPDEGFDNQPLVDAGQAAILEGRAVTTLTMEAEEPAGTKAFVAFTYGDDVTWIPHKDAEPLVDTVQAIRVVHDAEGLDVTPIAGDPDEADPDTQTAKLIRALRQDVQRLKTNRKRGPAA